ncbi:unnamed protein product [Rotaria sordida]|uniref:DUF4185 domain-containing protein n=1 Tax=Rotaria sordida TaxID=392033 RepID=A0A815RKF4_9BILA|nr:unnamed protein product [Rotaria sordida]CAF3820623.1 unnamed protein product [Rotaria sordida]
MQLLSLTIISLFIPFINAFRHPKILTQDRRLDSSQVKQACDPNEYILWVNTTVPDNFPLPFSEDLSTYLYAPDCASRYESADTWFVSWAADDLLYSGFTDGTVGNISSSSGAVHPNTNTTTGHAIIMGSNPLNLTIISPGVFTSNTGPYAGRYPSANLHYNGVWYQSTYGLSENDAPCQNWCVQGPLISFRYTVDQGHTWYDYNLHPKNDTDNLFNQSSYNRQKIKYGALHFVDFGKNQQWSPDGYVYLIGHGSNSSFPASLNTSFPIESWNEGDQIYLCRVWPSIQTINDFDQFEFWNGITYIPGKDGLDKAQPLFTFPNKTGTVTVSYIPALEKYLMVISTATYPGVLSMVKEFDIYILESNHIEGPWSLVEYLNKFGPEAYFPIIPTKFIGQSHDIKVLPDGSSLWPFYLGYSANFAYHTSNPNPPHSGYGFCLLSSKLVVKPEFTKRLIEKGLIQPTTSIYSC